MVALNAFALALVVASTGQAPGGETALLDFTADWCEPCRSMRPVVRRLQAEGYPVREIDLGRQPALKDRYGVTHIPCFVLMIDGREVDRAEGVTAYDQLASMAGRARTRLASGLPNEPAGPVPNVLPPVAPATAPAAAVTPDGLPARTPARPAGAADMHPGDEALLRASVRVRVDDGTGRSYGTGTIIDTRNGQALILTCGHLFREARDRGKIFVDLFLTGGATTVPADLISCDLTRDLAFLRIQPCVPLPVARVAPSGATIAPGDRVANVGCDNGQDPTVRQTHVTHIDRYAGPPNIEAAGTPVEGRSGGGLFDRHGHVVGVCFAADSVDSEGLYAGLASIHAELDRLGLADVYAAAPAAASPDTLAQVAPPPLPMPRQMPAPPAVQPASADQAVDQSGPPVAVGDANPNPSQDVPSPLSPAEQIALAEIRTRSRGAEVICIVRPADPSAKSEIFVLQNVSPEFIKKLTQNGYQRPAPHLTSMALTPRTGPCRQIAAPQQASDSAGWQAKQRLDPASRPQ